MYLHIICELCQSVTPPQYYIFRLNKEKYRKYRLCPVEGCKSKPQKKLANHLTSYHPELTANERKRYLRKAKVVGWAHIREEPSQSKLNFKTDRDQGQALIKTKQRLGRGRAVTRGLSRFESSHPELAAFKKHLMGLAGKKRSEKSAESIVTDISKILFFHNDRELLWENITNKQKLLHFMDKLDDMKVGPEGQLTKLERVCELYRFLKRTKRDDPQLIADIRETEEDIEQWKKSLRSEKKQLQVRRMEEASEMDMSLEAITEVVDSPQMWARFSDTVTRIKNGEEVPENDLKLAMGSVMLAIKLKSFQRPSSVINCTVNEYRNAIKSGDTTIIKVYNHKTQKQGPAKLTMDSDLEKRLKLYFKHVRPQLAEAGNDIENLFILPGSQRVNKFGNLERFLSRTLNMPVPTSTRARKIGATCSARSLDYQTHNLVTKQMSHQPDVSRKYYEAVHGAQDTAFAFQAMEHLRTSGSAPPSKPNWEVQTLNTTGCRWTPASTALVETQYSSYIKRGKTPGLGQCMNLALDKTPKQIQDKVRTLIRQRRKAASNDADDD